MVKNNKFFRWLFKKGKETGGEMGEKSIKNYVAYTP